MAVRRVVWMAIAVACLVVSLDKSGPLVAAANNWYVSAAGTGTGTQASPMSLAKALASTSPAQPGDTIWLRGGTYLGAFSSQLTGTAAAPIVVRGYPGERVTLDANTAAARAAGSLLAVGGAHVVFRDFEVTSSDTGRTDQNVGWGNFPSGIDINASTDIKLVNLVIHDLVGKGVGAWTENTDAEIYGCLIYYNGMSDHDHGIYLQNQTGRKRVADNILFDQASHGIHGYGSSDAYLDNITLEGNTVFENGGLLGQSARNILLGGGRVAQNPVVRANHTYLRGSLGNSNVGYTAGTANAVVQDNYWVAGNAAVRFNLDAGAVVTGNFFAGPLDPSDTATRWPSNTFAAAKPTTGQTVFVRPNQYEAGRATVTIYNWSKASTVAVSLTNTGLVPGDSFEIRDAMNFYGAPVAAGLYTGAPVSIPMTGLTAALPVGSSLTPPPHTAPAFGAFLVLKTAAGGASDSVPPTVTVTTPGAGQTLSGNVILAATASDDVGVTGVQFLVDGANAGTEDLTAPYTVSWNTTAASNGTHTITAVARDAAGHQATAPSLSVTVNNVTDAPPTVSLSGPSAGATVSGTVTLGATASDDVGVAGVWFAVDGVALGAEDTTSPYGVSWDTTTAANGTHALTATARDSGGHTTTSLAVSVSVNNVADAPPSVTVTAPSAGQTVSGSVMLAAVASDDKGVAGVQFKIDDVAVGVEDTTSPYSLAWDTTKLANGGHTISAVARDSAGKQSSSAAVATVVSNAPSAPANVRIVIEAEAGVLQSPMAKRRDTRASGKFYVSTNTANDGAVSYTIDLPEDARFVVWCRVLAPTDTRDSFSVLVDGTGADVYDVAEGTWSASWQWSVVNGRGGGAPATLNPRLFNLSKGRHTLTFAGREADTRLDQIIVTNDVTFVPR
jgi:hypothetical protein